jgi:TRAP-type C4-dicarboxylate transport system permease small subunit
MGRILDKVCAAWTVVSEAVGAVLMVAIVVSLFWQVFTRYILNAPATWTEEMARFCFIWFTMVGSAVVTRRGSHASITILSGRLRGKVRIIHRLLVCCLIIVVMGFVAYHSGPVIRTSASRLSAALLLPYSYIYWAVPVGCFGIILNVINTVVQMFARAGGAGAATA